MLFGEILPWQKSNEKPRKTKENTRKTKDQIKKQHIVVTFKKFSSNLIPDVLKEFSEDTSGCLPVARTTLYGTNISKTSPTDYSFPRC